MYILSMYLSAGVLHRTWRNLLLCIAFPSVLEAIERTISMPTALSSIDVLSLWVLSWPFYVVILLPGCLFAAWINCATTWSHTNEYQSFMAVGWSKFARTRVFISHACIIALAMFIINGWILPTARMSQQAILMSYTKDMNIPRFPVEKFSTLKSGSLNYIIYPFAKSNHSTKAFLIKEETTDTETDNEALKPDQTVYAVENMTYHNQQPVSIGLENGLVYHFTDMVLRQKIRFADLRLPLQVKQKNRFILDDESDNKTTDYLWDNKSQENNLTLWWRTNQALSVVVLAFVAVQLTPHYFCRQRPGVIMTEALLLFIFYYLLLVFAQTQAAQAPHFLWQYYALAHFGILLLSSLVSHVLNSRVLRCY
ncbi:MAG: LptF/LptG family permease [Pseudomonadota bacterium]|nr:LptF/LptG family permease [Pseudomonadota bacterium]